jgi:S1-C subfamily serine protease
MKRLIRLTAILAVCAAPAFLFDSGAPPSSAAEKPAALFKTPRLPADAQLGVRFAQLERALQARPASDPWKPRVNDEKTRGPAADVYAQVAPAVVVVKVGGGHGTGFIVDPAGWVITNHHVIAAADTDPGTGARKATVYLGRLEKGFMQLDEEGIPAKVYKSSEEKDLALLKLDRVPRGVEKLPALKLADEAPRPGDECVAIGHPKSGLLWTLRSGNVSGSGVWPKDMIQLVMVRLQVADKDRERLKSMVAAGPQRKVLLSTCGINPGDSGGPLVNAKGELIAVTFAIPKSDRQTGVSLDKFSYHVHLDELKAFLKDRPSAPALAVPDPWPAGVYSALLDLDGDGMPDTLGFWLSRAGQPTGFLLDLAQENSRKLTRDQLAGADGRRSWRFTVALHRHPQYRAFYATGKDGKIDLIMIDTDGDGVADVVYRLEKNGWVREKGKGRKLIDPDLIQDREQRERFVRIMRYLGRRE